MGTNYNTQDNTWKQNNHVRSQMHCIRWSTRSIYNPEMIQIYMYITMRYFPKQECSFALPDPRSLDKREHTASISSHLFAW